MIIVIGCPLITLTGKRKRGQSPCGVFSMLLFGAEPLLVKKLDNGVPTRHDPLDEFDTKSWGRVPTLSSNVFHMAFLDVLQKSCEVFALEVESRVNVLVDLVTWELLSIWAFWHARSSASWGRTYIDKLAKSWQEKGVYIAVYITGRILVLILLHVPSIQTITHSKGSASIRQTERPNVLL